MSLLRKFLDRRGGVEETVVTDDKTGGKKGSKLARFDLIPALPLWQVAEHYGRGAAKYEDRNWEKGYKWSLSISALQRHLYLFISGEDDDPDIEGGSPHLAAVVFHALALMQFRETHPELDDRLASGGEIKANRNDRIYFDSSQDMEAIIQATPEDPALEFQWGTHVIPGFTLHWGLRSTMPKTGFSRALTGRGWDGKGFITVDK